MEIAVVGAGVSGLVAAHFLSRVHSVTVFEANSYAGGHADTVRVDEPNTTQWIDTGFIVFNDHNYPNFERLLDGLAVRSQSSRMGFSVTDEAGNFEYASTSLNAVYANRRHLAAPSFHRMIIDLARCLRAGRAYLQSGADGRSLGQWLDHQGYSERFVEGLVIPLTSAIWSADPRSVLDMPVAFIFEFFANHGMLHARRRPRWRTVVGGSRTYVEALTRPLGSRLHLSARIGQIRRFDDHVTVAPIGAEPIRYDEVVIGVHADQALAMLPDATRSEQEILRAFPYQTNEAVLHTDVRMLPRRRRAWAGWNYRLFSDIPDRPTVTYYMNRLQSLDTERAYCVTLNQTSAIDESTVIRSVSYAHPVFTHEGQEAQRRHHEISGRNRTHYCGAYWRWGFHEDGVVSGLRVAESFGLGGA